MDITCEHCSGKFKIPDEKVPQGQTFSLSCPKCKNKITIDAREKPQADSPSSAPPPEPEKGLMDEVSAGSYDAGEKPFDFVEEGVETALLCEPDPEQRKKLRGILEEMGYQATESVSSVDALKQMRFHVFDVVVVNEMFDTDDPDECNVLKYLAHLNMDIRRNIFVALISDRFRTMDNMAAFNKSVNLVISLKNMGEFKKILKRGAADNATFYRMYRESMEKAGLI